MISMIASKSHPVKRCCEVLDVSTSGYYADRKNKPRDSDKALRIKIRAAFEENGKSYGSRRMVYALDAQGEKMGRYKMRRWMREEKLQRTWGKKYRITTTDSNHRFPVALNVLDRQFEMSAPNIAWVSDITYIRLLAGWLYLAVIMDLYSRKIIGWAMATSMDASLVISALRMAMHRAKPKSELLLHSDRGSQYASGEYQELLDEYGIICSMSRRANCWDNAVMERFFLNLKTERVWQKHYADAQEAKYDIVDYIENFYNTKRLHSALKYQTPADYEKQFYQQQKNLLLVSEII